MKQIRTVLWLTLLTLPGSIQPALAASDHVAENSAQVNAWNAFADALHTVHRQRLSRHDVTTEETTGGYGGVLDDPEFYRQIRYHDRQTGRLLSQIQWEQRRPDTIHSIEIHYYDERGRVARSYLATYLTDFRNAPIQTLINFHGYGDGLTAFRQFDASGVHLYDHCRGTHAGKDVLIALEEGDFLSQYRDDPVFRTEAYRACFDELPDSLGRYQNPLTEIAPQPSSDPEALRAPSVDEVERRIADLTGQIADASERGELYVKRGRAFHQLHRYDEAAQDLSAALEEDDALDDAYFWRGMVLGRAGRTAEAIRDFDVYIERHPEDSVAFTKRGVRYIWHGDLERAEQDLRQAIALDSRNAEAHDDLGVILARRAEYEVALANFQTAVRLEPTYQKGYHNLALVLFLLKRFEPALDAANASLRLSPDDRGSLLLKGKILVALDRDWEAEAAFEQAGFAAETKDWSETLPLQ